VASGRAGGLTRVRLASGKAESPQIALIFFRDLCYGCGPSIRPEFSGTWACSPFVVAGIMMPTQPTILELDMSDLEDVLRRAEAKLDEKDYALLKALADSYAYLTDLVGERNTSIARLRKLLFGAKTEKTAAVVGSDKGPEAPPSGNSGVEPFDERGGEDCVENDTAHPRPGHGRNGADAYVGAEKIEVPHPLLRPGDACPECQRGTIYETGRPGVLVRIVGQAPVQAKVYHLQKLRCGLCCKVFTADAPEGVGHQKYDATAGSMIALLKYGSGMPFNRTERLEGSVGIPLPASTQWDLVHTQAQRAEPVFEELIRQAAQGDVLFNDDTTVKILEMMDARAREEALAESAADGCADGLASKATDRKGMFTSGIVSNGEHKIALFLSGRQHAGENLKDVLLQRAAELPPPIQMCDALSRNLPGELKTIVAHCLAHGRRQFVDVAQQFPEECRRVLEALKVIYHNDAVARERGLSPEGRLQFHQAESGPAMQELHAWLVRQLDERLVEPNSGLGGAIAYLLKHWEKLTLFLRVPGAPLDNNTAERALKKAILHRKNALFYKTENGARVGDLFMSLIYTCELCGVSPFDYLTELDRHADDVASNPGNWMPWNYRQTLVGTAS
jgi:transposase